MELKNFQKKAIKDFKSNLDMLDYDKVLDQLAVDSSNIDFYKTANEDFYNIQLDAPTGSGKTIILGNIINEHLQDYVSIVFSPGQGNLEEQTYRKLASIVGEGKVHRFDEQLVKYNGVNGHVYVGNWEQFVTKDKATAQYKNKIAREGENKNFFDWIRELGSQYDKVALIIDEAHYGSKKGLSSINTFLYDIQETLGYSPLKIEASATHILKADYRIVIRKQDVVREGLMRKSPLLNNASVNEVLNKIGDNYNSVEELLLKAGLKQLETIDKEYIRVGAYDVIDGKRYWYHGLMGIQVPNGSQGNALIERVESILANLPETEQITRENGKLAVFLSDDKTANMEGIEKPNSPVKVLIYKQGVATGWDCPRAQVLIGYRHITSHIFTTQNLGRFLRTTEAKHYDNEILDHAYVFSNVGELGTSDFGKDADTSLTSMLTTSTALRVNKQKHISLFSFNEYNLPISHTMSKGQSVVKHQDVLKAFNKYAFEGKIWDKIKLNSKTQNLDLLSGVITDNGIEDKEYNVQNVEKTYLEYEDTLRTLVMSTVVESDRIFGNNGQVARILTNILRKWVKDTVTKSPNLNPKTQHFGTLITLTNNITIKDYDIFAIQQVIGNWDDVFKNVCIQTLNDKIVSSTRETKDGSVVSWREKKDISDDGVFRISKDLEIIVNREPDMRVNKDIADYYAFNKLSDNDAYYSGTVSMASTERKFEEFLQSLVDIKGKNNGRYTLNAFYKSPENFSTSYRFVINVSDDEIANFYPDWLVELFDNETMKYVPAIFETKDERAINDSLVVVKAKALFNVSKEHNIPAGVTFYSTVEDTMKIVTFDDKGIMVKEPLKEYIENFKINV